MRHLRSDRPSIDGHGRVRTRSARRRTRRGAGLACMVAGVFIAASSPFQAPRGALRLTGVSTCPDVAVFGARGSGEPATPAPGMVATVNNVGEGVEVSEVTEGIEKGLPSGTTVAAYGVDFSAPAIGGSSGDSIAALMNEFVDGGYAASIAQGAQWIDSSPAGVVTFATRCPHASIVLAGYSAGANVIDAGLNPAGGLPADVVNRLSAIVLLGDPEFQPDTSFDVGDINGTGAIVTAFDLFGSGVGPHVFSVPTALSADTQSYCIRHDVVCDTDLDSSIGPHLEYPQSPFIADADSFALQHVVSGTPTTGSVPTAPVSPPASRVRTPKTHHRRTAGGAGPQGSVSIGTTNHPR